MTTTPPDEGACKLAAGAVADRLIGAVRRDAAGLIVPGGLDGVARTDAVCLLSALGIYPRSEQLRTTGGAMVRPETKAVCGHHHWEDQPDI